MLYFSLILRKAEIGLEIFQFLDISHFKVFNTLLFQFTCFFVTGTFFFLLCPVNLSCGIFQIMSFLLCSFLESQIVKHLTIQWWESQLD